MRFGKPLEGTSIRRRWFLGLLYLSLVVFLWVLSSFLVKDLFESGVYKKPYFITYINTACFSLYLIPHLTSKALVDNLIREIRHRGNKLTQRKRRSLVDDNSTEDEYQHSNIDNEEGQELKISYHETFILSLQFMLLWMLANLATNASLSYTSVASQTILSSTSSVFTLIIGYLFSIESVNYFKIMGLILSFLGIVIIKEFDSSDEVYHSTLSVICGNILALTGAFIYGIYTTLLKLKTTYKNTWIERNLDTSVFFGLVGLLNLLLFWPFMIFFHFTGIERFELPQTRNIAIKLVINVMITFFSDFCWCKAILLTSPLTATVGLSMSIPLALVCSWFVKGFYFDFWYFFGAVLITTSFFMISKEEKQDFDNDRLG